MSRSCYTDNLTLCTTEYINQTREIKTNFSKMLAHIDYMLFKIEAEVLTTVTIDYRVNNTIEQLRELLIKRLIDYSNADKYRDLNEAFKR